MKERGRENEKEVRKEEISHGEAVEGEKRIKKEQTMSVSGMRKLLEDVWSFVISTAILSSVSLNHLVTDPVG